MKNRYLVYYRTFKRFFSAESPFEFKMVRFFPNPFEEYKPEVGLAIDKDEIGLRINDFLYTITKRMPPTTKYVEGGLYIGVTGVSYMFYYLSKNTVLSEKKSLYLTRALEYLKPALEETAGEKTSFLLGDAGSYALATVLHNDIGEVLKPIQEMYKGLYSHYLNPNIRKNGADELFVGRAGYLAGCLWINRELQTKIFKNEELYQICELMVASGREYSTKHNSPCPLMYNYYNNEYVGAAHGISFILQMLLTVPGYLEFNKSAAKDIKESVDFIASLQTEEGNWPCCMEELGQSDHKLVHWCHGAPGVVYLMAKAFLVYNEEKFFNACLKAGELVWKKGLLLKGPGICHGVAGSGYVFLLLHRLTSDEKYLYRAKAFADFLETDEFHRNARLPDNPQSLYEGTAGTVCFLSDLLVPDKAEFPFQDVFTNYDL